MAVYAGAIQRIGTEFRVLARARVEGETDAVRTRRAACITARVFTGDGMIVGLVVVMGWWAHAETHTVTLAMARGMLFRPNIPRVREGARLVTVAVRLEDVPYEPQHDEA